MFRFTYRIDSMQNIHIFPTPPFSPAIAPGPWAPPVARLSPQGLSVL